MAIDSSIYGNQQQPKFNTPFDVLGQMQQLQQQRQTIQSNQALEEERRLSIEKTKRSQAGDQALAQLLQQHTSSDPQTGLTSTDHQAVFNDLVKAGHPDKAEGYLTFADNAEKSLNAIQTAHLTMAHNALKMQGDMVQSVLEAPEDKRQAVWSAARTSLGLLMKNQPDAIAQIPEQYPGDDEAKRLSSLGRSQEEKIANALKMAETKKADAEAAKANKEATEPKAPTEATLDARAQELLSKKAMKQPLTPSESAELLAYQERKRTVSDPSALAAQERQTRTIDQQNAIQNRAQTFAEAQAGRSELTNKVEQPYLDAREKAETLRNTIAAAKSGNMAAANVQSLLATLGLVTMEGVKRINNTELQNVTGAGSLLERLKGSASKIVSGQPISPKIQSDLDELANMLETSARKKYEEGHAAVTTRYGLKDEKPIPATSGSAAPIEEWVRDANGRLVKKGAQ